MLGRWLGLLFFVCVGCGVVNLPGVRAPGEHIEVPESSSVYATDARADGVVGGADAQRLASDIASELAQRGATAQADGSLASAASWILRELNNGRSVGQMQSEAAARHYGFSGVVLAMAGFDPVNNAEMWRTAVQRVPANIPINRFGVSMAPSGRSAAVVFGAVEITVEPIPRHLEVGQSVTLRGEVGPRFQFAHLYLTKVDGSVDERRMPSRKVEASFSFPTAGRYKLEVMGDGPTGPVIVYNVPLYVGIEEADVTGVSGSVTDPTEAEARLTELTNQARRAAGVPTLLPDEPLRAVALAHSEDMVEHHFFGHVSPTTGTTDDRARRSGIVASLFGENVADADSAENAFEGLMASPGHRANMLRADFTHLGVAAVRGEHSLAFTMMFARRADPTKMPKTAGEVEAAFLALRKQKGVPLPPSDPLYRASVEAGIAAYVENSSSEAAGKAMNQALGREVQRAKSSRAGGCSFIGEIIELSQLSQYQILTSTSVKRYGLAARVLDNERGRRLAFMIVLEGAPCN